ncbi:hypothetical protein BIFDEN_00492 [Bifidobacterium dentium ATCC 27678]|nr:hypothetical protein BIFDEN_00492 [Bifidobacterium dentium ATCC 27678]
MFRLLAIRRSQGNHRRITVTCIDSPPAFTGPIGHRREQVLLPILSDETVRSKTILTPDTPVVDEYVHPLFISCKRQPRASALR